MFTVAVQAVVLMVVVKDWVRVSHRWRCHRCLEHRNTYGESNLQCRRPANIDSHNGYPVAGFFTSGRLRRSVPPEPWV
jgi:hypothetical protein